MTTTVRVPEERSRRVPAEQRGPGRDRDSVRLLVSCGTEVSHHAFVELPRRLRAGDLLIVNTSPRWRPPWTGGSGTRAWWCISARGAMTDGGPSSCGIPTEGAPHVRARGDPRVRRYALPGTYASYWRSR